MTITNTLVVTFTSDRPAVTFPYNRNLPSDVEFVDFVANRAWNGSVDNVKEIHTETTVTG